MANVWTAQADIDMQPRRATFDKSFQNNLTMKFGAITPVYCQEVIAGDSVRIQPTFGLRFMPLVFPTQTRMRAYMHFYYVRSRTLWKDWQDFIYSTKKNLVPPYLSSKSPTSLKTRSLADYLGVPTYVYGNFSKTSNFKYSSVGYLFRSSGQDTKQRFYYKMLVDGAESSQFRLVDTSTSSSNIQGYVYLPFNDSGLGTVNVVPKVLVFNFGQLPSGVSSSTKINLCCTDENNEIVYIDTASCAVSGNKVTATFPVAHDISMHGASKCYFLVDGKQTMTVSTMPQTMFQTTISATFDFNDGVDVDDLAVADNPYRNGKINLSVLPFRAYESIYNAYYRNQQNDPFKIDGEIEYNKWIPSDEGGEDKQLYELHYRNWELDQFTSCLPSPQSDGLEPPLVGLVNRGVKNIVAFSDEDGLVHSATPEFDDGGNLVSVHMRDISDGRSDIVPVTLADVATQGITIEDFRFVNAVQRFLELKIRKGFRYKDLTKGYYGVDIKFDELMMPEFIGGLTQDVNVNQVTSTSATSFNGEDTPLGSYAGQASCFGQSGVISKYCDEAGFIIGVLTVVPVPVYSQVLPKFFLKKNALDYYFPQFANIGYQPVKYDELCPLQYYLNSGTNPVFGYQRAWYDYVSSLDTVHGDFRNSLKNFLMNRVFDGIPELGHDFLKVDPEQLNQVFVSTDATDDKILGEIWFDVTYKSAVPYTIVPSLE